MRKRAKPKADPPNLDRLDAVVREINNAIGHAASVLNQTYVHLQHVRLKFDDMRGLSSARRPAPKPKRRRAVR